MPRPVPRHRRSIRAVLACLAALCGTEWAAAQPPAAAGRHSPARPALVFTQVPVTPEPNWPQSAGSVSSPDPPARLVLLAPDGSTRVLTPSFHSATDADVSPDGRRILFAGQKRPGDAWDVYEMDLQSLKERQVTRNVGRCQSPIYTSSFFTISQPEPWEQIAFVKTQGGQLDERDGGPVTSLYTCKLSGSLPERITYNLSSDLDPAIMPDGRIAYASWHRATLDLGVAGRLALEAVNTDGSDRAILVPRSPGRLRRMPCITTDGNLVVVEADPAARDGAGRLAGASLRSPLHTYRTITGPHDGLYSSPSAFPDGQLVVAWRSGDAGSSFGLYRFDPATGQRALILDDPRFHELKPRAVFSRPRPMAARAWSTPRIGWPGSTA